MMDVKGGRKLQLRITFWEDDNPHFFKTLNEVSARRRASYIREMIYRFIGGISNNLVSVELQEIEGSLPPDSANDTVSNSDNGVDLGGMFGSKMV